jgi:hypothetical protein
MRWSASLVPDEVNFERSRCFAKVCAVVDLRAADGYAGMITHQAPESVGLGGAAL